MDEWRAAPQSPPAPHVQPSEDVDVADGKTMSHLEDVLTRLKFLGSIQPHDKISTTKLLRQPPSIWQPFERMLYGDDRQKCLTFVKTTLRDGFQSLREAHSEPERLAILGDTRNAIASSLNLRYTYTNDTRFVCQLDVILDGAKRRLLSIGLA